jgi:TolA-binding protein
LYEGRQEYDSARKYYQRTIEFSEKSNYTESGYYLFALISLGEIAAREGDNAEARRYFQMVKQKSGRKDEAFKAAKQRLKNMERGD